MNKYWKNRQLLITGATGFIGSNAVDFFLKNEANITATISPNTSQEEIEKKLGKNRQKIHLIQADLFDKNTVREIMDGIEIVMNFAAIDGGMKFKIEHSQEIYKKNTSIVKNLLDAAVTAHIQSFLLVSSSDIYDYKGETPITETMVAHHSWDIEKDGYKLAKWQSEQDALETAKMSDVNMTIIRSANIYGPRDNFEDVSKIRFIPSVIRKIYLEKNPVIIWGDGSQIKSFLFVEDFLEICSSLIEKSIFNTPVNVASKQTITLKDLAQKIVEISKTKTKVVTDPQKPSGPQKSLLDISLLEKELGGPITETNLEDGIQQTINYFTRLIDNKKQ